MPWGLKRFQETGQVHFITFSCYRRRPNLKRREPCATFVAALERVRRDYGLCVYGYVAMPEHVHLPSPRGGPARQCDFPRWNSPNNRHCANLLARPSTYWLVPKTYTAPSGPEPPSGHPNAPAAMTPPSETEYPK